MGDGASKDAGRFDFYRLHRANAQVWTTSYWLLPVLAALTLRGIRLTRGAARPSCRNRQLSLHGH
jgi:hypothetical protein